MGFFDRLDDNLEKLSGHYGGGSGSEGRQFVCALIAPVGVTVMDFVLGFRPLVIGGLIFTGLILVAALLRRMS